LHHQLTFAFADIETVAAFIIRVTVVFRKKNGFGAIPWGGCRRGKE
jgi:hypothetical protein